DYSGVSRLLHSNKTGCHGRSDDRVAHRVKARSEQRRVRMEGMQSLAGKVSIVTGASKGIGRAIGLRLASEGSHVVLCARDEAALDAVAAECAGRAATIALDLRLPSASAKLTDFALNRFGKVDIVVNNAGATKRGDFLELTDDDFADGF